MTARRSKAAAPSARDLGALLELIDRRQAEPHAIGRIANDCVSFAAAAVQAQTGVNPLGRHRWTTLTGGLRVLKRLGGAATPRNKRMEAALDALFERIAPAQAMRGDIAGVADPVLGIHPAIVEGETLVGPGTSGTRRFPRRAMVAAWSAVAPPPQKRQPAWGAVPRNDEPAARPN